MNSAIQVLIRPMLACLAAFVMISNLQADHGLFESQDALEISLALDFGDLCHPREDENCDYTPTTLEFSSATDGDGRLPVEVLIRGGWRSMESNCTAPLLFVRFDESTTAGTPFSHQKVLPLTTHCGQGLSLENIQSRVSPVKYEQYLLKEYLGYRLHNLVSDVSLKVRLVKIRYPDPDKPSKEIRSHAFFTEHFDSLAARSNSRVMERWTFDHEKLDTLAADRLAMYQYMIGNTDWSIPRQRNILLLEDAEGTQIPVPFDLDMSGLVNAHYAGPPPTLPINSVTQRYYLGYCRPDVEWAALYDYYVSIQPDVMSEVEALEDLDNATRRSTRRFLNIFFDTLDSEKKCNQRFVEHCHDWPPTENDHMKVK